METFEVHTSRREELLRVTSALQELVDAKGWRDGALVVYCPHTTAALTINEAADPDVAADLVMALSRLLPREAGYKHVEGNSDSHVKTTLVGPSQMLIVSGGRIQLGTWQGVFLCEWDGPRNRKIWAQWLGQ
ncbi:secondary thiamine-phosphate synthase enzyme YjbQ [Solidesulfovibrio alcoholivorans]|uniref:secondary thiamine-phosphate synthase enzyme YjbQ n=1 Tax=Solidesulfovibrio alcoholivorans TaxID=81406 RepID=UPI00049518AD|nr:secondary thiamine-phosphate synthase enzyme YjbQ [Solidesulfovibrio alcoholivorans]